MTINKNKFKTEYGSISEAIEAMNEEEREHRIYFDWEKAVKILLNRKINNENKTRFCK